MEKKSNDLFDTRKLVKHALRKEKEIIPYHILEILLSRVLKLIFY